MKNSISGLLSDLHKKYHLRDVIDKEQVRIGGSEREATLAVDSRRLRNAREEKTIE